MLLVNTNALSYYKKILHLDRMARPSNKLDIAGYYASVGRILYQLKEYKTALVNLHVATRLYEQVNPSDETDLSHVYNYIGSLYQETGNYANAITFFEKLVPIQEQILPQTQPDLDLRYCRLNFMYTAINQTVEISVLP